MKRFLSTFGLLIAEVILVFWTVLCACIFQCPLILWEIPMLFACVLWIPGLSKVIWDRKCGRGYYTNSDKRKNVKKIRHIENKKKGKNFHEKDNK